MEQEKRPERRTSGRRRQVVQLNDAERRVRKEPRHGVGRRVQIRRISEILVVVDRRVPGHRRASEQRRSGVKRRHSVRRASLERRESKPTGPCREEPAA